MELRRKTKQTSLPFNEVKKRVVRGNKCSSHSSENQCSIKKQSVRRSFSTPRKSLSFLQNADEIRLSSSVQKSISKLDSSDNCSPNKKPCISDGNEFSLDNTITTPSSYISKLQIESPSKLETENILKLKRSPRKELFPISQFKEARRAFHSSTPQSLPGRELQTKQIEEFLKRHLKEQSSGSLYISGLPGTGKTASVMKVIQCDEVQAGCQITYINCTSLQSSGAIYKSIIQSLKIKSVGKSEKQYLSEINKFLSRKHKMILLILDEVDQLSTKTQSVLYTIFEWPSKKGSRIILVGIANAMDLTDRILPRLCMKVELKPILIHFAPYTKHEIVTILSHRLFEAKVTDVFAQSALELIAGKVAAASGDIRKALDLSRRIVETSSSNFKTILENELKHKEKNDSFQQSGVTTPKKILRNQCPQVELQPNSSNHLGNLSLQI